MLDISVIVPVYQAEEYLERCLQSLAHQTLQNFEVILIDDGSTDGSAAICDDFAKRDRHFRVVHQVNKGIGAVRNLGLEMAEGQYISFVDSDDYIAENMLEQMLAYIREKKADLLICDFFMVDGIHIQRRQQLTAPAVWQDDTFMQYIANEKILSFPWNKLYRKELFAGIRYPLNMAFEDQYIFHRLVQRAECIAYVNDAYYYYRINPNGLSRSLHTKNAYDCFRADLERQCFMVEYYPQYAESCWNHIINNACNTCWRYLYTGQGKEYADAAKDYLRKYQKKFFCSSSVSLNAKGKILSVILGINKLKWQKKFKN